MRRRFTMLVMAAMLALTMSLGGAGAAFADSGKNPSGMKIGNKSTNPNDGNGAVKNGSFKPGQ